MNMIKIRTNQSEILEKFSNKMSFEQSIEINIISKEDSTILESVSIPFGSSEDPVSESIKESDNKVEEDKISFDFTKYFVPNEDSSITIDFTDNLFSTFILLERTSRVIPEEYRKILFAALVDDLKLPKDECIKFVIKTIIYIFFGLVEASYLTNKETNTENGENSENKTESSSNLLSIDKFKIIKDENGKLMSITIPEDMISLLIPKEQTL